MSYYNFTFDTVPYLGINLTPTIINGFYAKIGHVKISIILTQRGTYERQDSLKCWVTSTSEKKNQKKKNISYKLYQYSLWLKYRTSQCDDHEICRDIYNK